MRKCTRHWLKTVSCLAHSGRLKEALRLYEPSFPSDKTRRLRGTHQRALVEAEPLRSQRLEEARDELPGAWERLVEKLTPLAPGFFERHTPAARAYQLRYLCRRAISDGDAAGAARLARRSLASSRRPLWEEPTKSATTFAAALALGALGPDRFQSLRNAHSGRAATPEQTL